MANGQDRFDNNAGGSGFLMGMLAGAVVGAGLGMLFAPKAGSELRSQLSGGAGALADRAQDGYRAVTQNAGQWAAKGKAAADDWTERGMDMVGKARDAVSRGADEAQSYVRDATSAVTGATPTPTMAGGAGATAPTNSSSQHSHQSHTSNGESRRS